MTENAAAFSFKSDTTLLVMAIREKNDVVRWCIVSSEMGADLKDSCDCQSNGGGLKRTNCAPTTQKFSRVAHVSECKVLQAS